MYSYSVEIIKSFRGKIFKKKKKTEDSPGDAVNRHSFADAEDMGLIPNLGRLCMLQATKAREP